MTPPFVDSYCPVETRRSLEGSTESLRDLLHPLAVSLDFDPDRSGVVGPEARRFGLVEALVVVVQDAAVVDLAVVVEQAEADQRERIRR
jgi:hypothetical protein